MMVIGHRDPEVGDAVHEVARAVDRVDDPEVIAGEDRVGDPIAAVQLLAQHGMVGERLRITSTMARSASRSASETRL